ncbi:MAG: C1 family peptidase, partial [Candidatus Zixiibacteriota bacterium]
MRTSRIFGIPLLVLLTAASSVGYSEPVEGGLTSEVIQEVRQSFKMDTPTRALMNALTNNDIKKLALNRDKYVAHDNLFSHKIKTKGITNQKSSGRCWLFAGLN